MNIIKRSHLRSICQHAGFPPLHLINMVTYAGSQAQEEETPRLSSAKSQPHPNLQVRSSRNVCRAQGDDEDEDVRSMELYS